MSNYVDSKIGMYEYALSTNHNRNQKKSQDLQRCVSCLPGLMWGMRARRPKKGSEVDSLASVGGERGFAEGLAQSWLEQRERANENAISRPLMKGSQTTHVCVRRPCDIFSACTVLHRDDGLGYHLTSVGTCERHGNDEHLIQRKNVELVEMVTHR